MFLNPIKSLFLKKKLKNNLHNVKPDSNIEPIKTIGLLIDESSFLTKDELIKEIVFNGILEKNIKVIVYRDFFKKNKVFSRPTFGIKDFTLTGKIVQPFISEFINTEFDLLISYYDVKKSVLLLLTNQSKAKFKVGFGLIDKRLNHFIIHVNIQDYKVFTYELFKYLKKLNKI